MADSASTPAGGTSARRARAEAPGFPPWPGGKRRLLPVLFGLIAEALPPAAWRGQRFVDPFLGSGIVAHAAKRRGFHVEAADVAERSVVVGRALVANDTTRLAPAQVVQLLQPSPAQAPAAPALLARIAPPLRQRLATVWRRLHDPRLTGVERDLMLCLTMHAVLGAFPLSLPTASDAGAFAAGDYDRLTPARRAHYAAAAQRRGAPRWWLTKAAAINACVAPGQAHVRQGDALALLPQIEAEVVYCDPPYGGTQAYERALAPLDAFCGFAPAPRSPFSTRDAPLDALLDAARHIPILVLSQGNALAGPEALAARVARHRDVRRVVALPYRHYGSVASAAKNARNQEIAILATTSRSCP